MQTLEVEVTLDDICEAILRLEEAKYISGKEDPGITDGYTRSHNCPIAIAAERAGYKGSVDSEGLWLEEGWFYAEGMRRFVCNFDARNYWSLQPTKLSFHCKN